MSTPTQTISLLDPNRWKALALLCTAFTMTTMDGTIMQVALPAIKEGLGYTQVSLQWVVNAYIIFLEDFCYWEASLAICSANGAYLCGGIQS